jgi:hypothetical protein
MWRIGLGLLVMASIAGTAVAADENSRASADAEIRASVTPANAGSTKAPRGVAFRGSIVWSSPDELSEPQLLETARLFLPRHFRYDVGSRPSCTRAVLNRRGRSGCPPRSVIGEGVGISTQDSSAPFKVKYLFFNGGGNAVHILRTRRYPFKVVEVISARVAEIKHRRWRYKLEIPLQITGGVIPPMTLEIVHSLRYAFGGSRPSGSVFATVGCPPSGSLPYAVETQLTNQDGSTAATRSSTRIRCE